MGTHYSCQQAVSIDRSRENYKEEHRAYNRNSHLQRTFDAMESSSCSVTRLQRCCYSVLSASLPRGSVAYGASFRSGDRDPVQRTFDAMESSSCSVTRLQRCCYSVLSASLPRGSVVLFRNCIIVVGRIVGGAM